MERSDEFKKLLKQIMSKDSEPKQSLVEIAFEVEMMKASVMVGNWVLLAN